MQAGYPIQAKIAVPAENSVLVDSKRLTRFALSDPIHYDGALQDPN